MLKKHICVQNCMVILYKIQHSYYVSNMLRFTVVKLCEIYCVLAPPPLLEGTGEKEEEGGGWGKRLQ